jgi:preprotein translocase subunit SecG
MTGILIGILYLILVVTCLFLGLLILVQLPKKDAGAGMAFGGGAGEALFGAGSGNVLTKLTKYSATTFLVLALLLSVIVSKAAKEESSGIEESLASEVNAPTAEPLPNPASGTMPLEASETIELPPVQSETQSPALETQTDAVETTEALPQSGAGSTENSDESSQ